MGHRDGIRRVCVEEDEEIAALRDEERRDWSRFEDKGMGRVRRVARWLRP